MKAIRTRIPRLFFSSPRIFRGPGRKKICPSVFAIERSKLPDRCFINPGGLAPRRDDRPLLEVRLPGKRSSTLNSGNGNCFETAREGQFFFGGVARDGAHTPTARTTNRNPFIGRNCLFPAVRIRWTRCLNRPSEAGPACWVAASRALRAGLGFGLWQCRGRRCRVVSRRPRSGR